MTQIRGIATQLQENSGDLPASLQKVVRPLQPGVPDAQRLQGPEHRETDDQAQPFELPSAPLTVMARE